MPQVVLTVDSIGDLDSGAARQVIDKLLREAAADLDDRGSDGKDRVTTIAIHQKQLDNGMVLAWVEGNVKVPAYKTAGTMGRLRKQTDNQPVLMFQPFDPNPDQEHLPYPETRSEE